jgi:glycosyltransferase involved in cell wall biosynthesis
VANSRYTADVITRNVPDYQHVHVIYNGINLDRFTSRLSEPQKPLILAVGRLVEKKGFGVLVEACRLLTQREIDFECDLVGTGRLSEAIKQQITSAGLGHRVRMVGPLAQEELRRRYEQAQICALPCIEGPDGDRDMLPNVLKEAMAVGVPVVTSQLAGIDELVEHAVTGLLTPPSDSRALADCLQLLLADGELRRRLTQQARQTIAARFDCRKNFTQLKRLLESGGASVKPSAQIEDPQTFLSHASRLR